MTDTPVAGGFIGLATLGRTPRPDFEKTFAPHLAARRTA